MIELSHLRPLVKALNGTLQGEERFFFPTAMLSRGDETQLFDAIYEEFQKYIKNGSLHYLRRPSKKNK